MLLVSERLSLSYIQCLIGKLYEFLELQLFQITIYIYVKVQVLITFFHSRRSREKFYDVFELMIMSVFKFLSVIYLYPKVIVLPNEELPKH